MREKQTKKQIPLRISDAIYEKLARAAREDMRSVNSEIEYILSEVLQNRYNTKADSNDKNGNMEM